LRSLGNSVALVLGTKKHGRASRATLLLYKTRQESGRGVDPKPLYNLMGDPQYHAKTLGHSTISWVTLNIMPRP